MSPFRASLWVRFWAAFSGWFSPSPQPPSPQPSATLDADEEPVRVIPEQVARTLGRLDMIAERLISGDISGLVLFAEDSGAIDCMWQFPPGADKESMAVALKQYAHNLHLTAVRLQGNAPPNNRSELTQ
jgi:hypothetical protein